MGGRRHLSGQLDPLLAFAGVVAGQGVGPEQERAEPADFDPDRIGQLPDRGEFAIGGSRRKVVLQIIVELDPIEPRRFGQPQAFL
jgi:hypothetical protein